MNIGILGGGQLARMLTIAAQPMNFQTLCLTEHENDPANGVTKKFPGSFHSQKNLTEFCQAVSVVTFETENIPKEIAEFCEKKTVVSPNKLALTIAQDRLLEKQLFYKLDIQTPLFFDINSEIDLKNALEKTGYPAVLKTRTMGYDGKGQYWIRCENDIAVAYEKLRENKLILEAYVAFEKEISVLAVRSNLQTKFYPIVENIHKNGILYCSKIIEQDQTLQQQAEDYACRILQHLDYRGVLAIEFFVHNGQLIANEMAPRVHNSGHWTIEGSYTSQFENHLRAICDLPLGNCEAKSFCVMFNFIGTLPPIEQLLQVENLHYHDYGKEPRTDRKLGHATILHTDKEKFESTVHQLSRWIAFNKAY